MQEGEEEKGEKKRKGKNEKGEGGFRRERRGKGLRIKRAWFVK